MEKAAHGENENENGASSPPPSIYHDADVWLHVVPSDAILSAIVQSDRQYITFACRRKEACSMRMTDDLYVEQYGTPSRRQSTKRRLVQAKRRSVVDSGVIFPLD